MGTPRGGLRVPQDHPTSRDGSPQCEVPLGTDGPKKGCRLHQGKPRHARRARHAQGQACTLGKHCRQISAIIPNLLARPQSPASVQQSLWKVGEEEKAKHFKGSTKLL